MHAFWKTSGKEKKYHVPVSQLFLKCLFGSEQISLLDDLV